MWLKVKAAVKIFNCKCNAYSNKCITVLGSDVIYSEEAVMDLLETLVDLCGRETTIILAGELRNGI